MAEGIAARAQSGSPMRILLAFLLLTVVHPAGAQETIGRVRAIYYEAARGVLVEQRMAHARASIRWADVETASRRLLVELPSDMDPAPGDLVAVRLADPKTSQLAQILPAVAINRAVEAGSGASVGR